MHGVFTQKRTRQAYTAARSKRAWLVPKPLNCDRTSGVSVDAAARVLPAVSSITWRPTAETFSYSRLMACQVGTGTASGAHPPVHRCGCLTGRPLAEAAQYFR